VLLRFGCFCYAQNYVRKLKSAENWEKLTHPCAKIRELAKVWKSYTPLGENGLVKLFFKGSNEGCLRQLSLLPFFSTTKPSGMWVIHVRKKPLAGNQRLSLKGSCL
jgi:hypothetical protein